MNKIVNIIIWFYVIVMMELNKYDWILAVELFFVKFIKINVKVKLFDIKIVIEIFE